MPKISDEHRAQRRDQILDAARRCFHRHGVQATTMEQIIAASGLSASAMYRYFEDKDDIVAAAVTTSLEMLALRLDPIVDADDGAGPIVTVERLLDAIQHFAKRPEYDLIRIAVQGWSEAMRNRRLHTAMRRSYGAFRERLSIRVQRWQTSGEVDPSAQADDVAQSLLSLVLGFVVQSALLGDVAPRAHAEALQALRARALRGRAR